jgi:hypothetical protein
MYNSLRRDAAWSTTGSATTQEKGASPSSQAVRTGKDISSCKHKREAIIP